MGSAESPAAARRRLRLALRRAREVKGLTQGHVAEALDWSLSKIQRIESGEVTVSRNDLLAALAYLDISDQKRVEQLVQLAKASRLKGWWDDARYREHLTPAVLQLLQFEAEASAIRVFCPTLIPGMLQTRAYGDYVLDFWKDELTEKDQDVRLDVRVRRREFVMDAPDPPDYLVVLDDSVLQRRVGGPEVMADQLDSLLEMTKSPKVIVRVFPFSSPAPLTMLSHFIILDLGDEENAVVYREGQLTDYIEHSTQIIQIYRRRFEQLWENAMSEEESRVYIAEIAASMRAPSEKTRSVKPATRRTLAAGPKKAQKTQNKGWA
jgi:transcriptional regulator with XRE-family HTH domain